MKLTLKKIRYIIKHKKIGESSKTIAIDMKISKRRVEQIWKYYSETGKVPIIGGRPEKPLDPKEVEIVKIAFERYKFNLVQICLKISSMDSMKCIFLITEFILSCYQKDSPEKKKRRRKRKDVNGSDMKGKKAQFISGTY